jgi:hypothetical protein
MPTLFFAFAAAGVAPALTYYVELMYQLFKAAPRYGITFEIVLYFIHSVIWTLIIYVSAKVISSQLCKIKSGIEMYLFLLLVVVMLLVGLAPIYGGGHSTKGSINVYQLYEQLWNSYKSPRSLAGEALRGR